MMSHRSLASLARKQLGTWKPPVSRKLQRLTASPSSPAAAGGLLACWFSSSPPPGGTSYRLPRSGRGSGDNRGGFDRRGGGGSGRGPPRGGGSGKPRRENPYAPRDRNAKYISQAGVPGSRPHSITLFPGDYSDNPSVVDDDEYNYKQEEGPDPEKEKLKEILKQKEAWEEERRQRWLKNAKPKEWKSIIDDRGRAYGRGGRKRAQARAWISPGLGEIVINQKPFCDYFDRQSDRELILQPFGATETLGAFDVQCAVKGGGLTGQAGAIRLGIARALNAYNPDLYRPALKFLGYLTRDARKVERKVQGRVKARKRPQWVRR